MKRNILLFIILIILSIFLAIPFGNILNKYVFTISGGFGTFSLPNDLSSIINGLLVSYLFLVPILFIYFNRSNKIRIVTILSIPALIFSYIISTEYLFWSLIFFASGIALSLILQKFFKRNL